MESSPGWSPSTFTALAGLIKSVVDEILNEGSAKNRRAGWMETRYPLGTRGASQDQHVTKRPNCFSELFSSSSHSLNISLQ